MPAPRFSLRTLLVTVTILSVVCAIGGGLWNRSVRFQELCDYHNSHANTFFASPSPLYLTGDESSEGLAAMEKLRREYQFELEREVTWRLYHAEMAKKYSAAAKKPWLIVPDDPPEPPRP